MEYSVMIVDDHKMVREGLKRILELNNIKVIDEANNGMEFLKKYKSLQIKPDVVLLDINMPVMSGIEVLKSFTKRGIPSRILMLTVHNEVEYLIETIDLGIDGYLLKDSDSHELCRAIDYVCRGEFFIQPSLIPLLNSKLIAKDIDGEKISLLSDREIEVLKLVAIGHFNKEIGEKLNISERTVKNHLSSIFKKLTVTDRTQAAVFAIRNGLVIIN